MTTYTKRRDSEKLDRLGSGKEAPMMRVWIAGVFFVGAAFAADTSVTFSKDVLPILQAKCQECHRPGEIAPMSFLTFQSTRPWAKAMKAAVLAKKMPPWGADPRYGHFANDPSLTQREIDTLVNWVDNGVAEGDPRQAPPPVRWPEGWRSQ